MGKHNRWRRGDQHENTANLSTVPDLVAAVLLLAAQGREHDVSLLTEHFVARAQRENLWSELSHDFADRLTATVERAWRRGWQPADLAHVVGKRLQARHRQICADAIGLQAQTYRRSPGADPRWLAQLDAVSSDVPGVSHPALFLGWTHSFGGLAAGFVGAVETLALLQSLPTQPRLCVPPSDWTDTPPSDADAASRSADPKMIERVRALLAKAESTDFPDEAETFTAKAQELIARHAIDQAMLAGVDAPNGAVGRRFLVDDPYGRPKSLLLDVVAQANACSTVWADQLGLSTVFGATRDIDAVELLYASLLTQATAAMAAAGRSEGARSRVRSFRQAFLVAYASRIGERLRDATSAAVDEARAVHGDSLLPVLASRDVAATEARDDAFPQLRKKSISFTNHAGWLAGRTAADLARLGPEAELPRR